MAHALRGAATSALRPEVSRLRQVVLRLLAPPHLLGFELRFLGSVPVVVLGALSSSASDATGRVLELSLRLVR
jgi:hypothetical protein